MIVTLHTQGLQTLAQVRAFVSGNEAISFTLTDRHAAYGWMADTLRKFNYGHATRTDKGVLHQYLCKVSGFSRAQVARCITQFTDGGQIKDRRHAPAVPFVRRYMEEDILSACWPRWMYCTVRCPALPRASCANEHSRCMAMRASSDWRAFPTAICITCGSTRTISWYAAHSTRPRLPGSTLANGANHSLIGRPGYLRVDSVHQGDLDGIKGIYLINAVDEVTQCQAVCAVERISELFLLPVLKAMMDAFPFVIRGFHSDNGSEYINHQCANIWVTAIFRNTAPAR
jgi:hypothetical protein